MPAMDEKQVLSNISKVRELAYAMIESELLSEHFEGVLPSHGNILHLLFRNQKPIPVNEIVQQTGKAKSTVTSNLKTLEKYGYITKMVNPKDSRSTLISLTEKGCRLLPLFETISERVRGVFYQNLSTAEKQAFLQTLEKIEKNLR
jgi:DNA-binding MarR family transcriptional regulator